MCVCVRARVCVLREGLTALAWTRRPPAAAAAAAARGQRPLSGARGAQLAREESAVGDGEGDMRGQGDRRFRFAGRRRAGGHARAQRAAVAAHKRRHVVPARGLGGMGRNKREREVGGARRAGGRRACLAAGTPAARPCP